MGPGPVWLEQINDDLIFCRRGVNAADSTVTYSFRATSAFDMKIHFYGITLSTKPAPEKSQYQEIRASPLWVGAAWN